MGLLGFIQKKAEELEYFFIYLVKEKRHLCEWQPLQHTCKISDFIWGFQKRLPYIESDISLSNGNSLHELHPNYRAITKYQYSRFKDKTEILLGTSLRSPIPYSFSSNDPDNALTKHKNASSTLCLQAKRFNKKQKKPFHNTCGLCCFSFWFFSSILRN